MSLITVGMFIGRHLPGEVSADPRVSRAAPIPLSYGSCKAAALFQMPNSSTAKSCLVFEDDGGVIRLVDTKTGKLALSFGRN